MLANLDALETTATPIAEQVPDRLATGRIALVGDAAHVPTPMTGGRVRRVGRRRA